MQVFSELPVAGDFGPTSFAVGNFDGVHRGHAEVIAAARNAAEAHGANLGVVSFEPHPRDVFQPGGPPFRLSLPPLKARRLGSLGVEILVLAPFTRELIRLSAEEFALDILGRRLGASHVAVGADFRFGAARRGDVELLRKCGEEGGFGVSAVELIGGVEPFSSTRIRSALEAGDPREAARMLGDWHRLEGIVEHGDHRGRELGYPTANLDLGRMLQPRFGVYATRVEVLDGPYRGAYGAVSSLGMRPTFASKAPNLETFIFDFDGDLYGATLSVCLCAYLRSEVRFDGLAPLIKQMDADSAQARAILADLSEPWA